MRIPVLIAMAILISASPAMAKSKDTTSGSPIFGSVKCSPKFSCANIDDPEKMAAIEEIALNISNRCVAHRLIKNQKSNSFFKRAYGLNSNLCFKANAQPKGKSGLAMTPQCCIKTVNGNKNKCYVRCNLIGKR